MNTALDPEEIKRELMKALEGEDAELHPERTVADEDRQPLDALGHPAAEEEDQGLPAE